MICKINRHYSFANDKEGQNPSRPEIVSRDHSFSPLLLLFLSFDLSVLPRRIFSPCLINDYWVSLRRESHSDWRWGKSGEGIRRKQLVGLEGGGDIPTNLFLQKRLHHWKAARSFIRYNELKILKLTPSDPNYSKYHRSGLACPTLFDIPNGRVHWGGEGHFGANAEYSCDAGQTFYWR